MSTVGEMAALFRTITEEQKQWMKSLGVMQQLGEKFPSLRVASALTDSHMDSVLAAIVQEQNVDAFNELLTILRQAAASWMALAQSLDHRQLQQSIGESLPSNETKEINSLLRDKIHLMNKVIANQEKTIQDLKLRNELLAKRLRRDEAMLLDQAERSNASQQRATSFLNADTATGPPPEVSNHSRVVSNTPSLVTQQQQQQQNQQGDSVFPITVNIRMPSGTTLKINVCLDETIAQLKQKIIAINSSVSIQCMTLAYFDRILLDHHTIQQSALKPNHFIIVTSQPKCDGWTKEGTAVGKETNYLAGTTRPFFTNQVPAFIQPNDPLFQASNPYSENPPSCAPAVITPLPHSMPPQLRPRFPHFLNARHPRRRK